MDKHIYLRNIQDTNETLFYRLVQNHISEMMPIIYTPTVGAACENFSNIYRRGRGLFISYANRDRIDDLLNNAANHNVKVIVVTDGERILGLGDQGIGGMGIPIGKLSLYTACGGISPAYTLPVVLDVGTNNPQRLADPMYMGWRHPRITGPDYDNFVEEFMQAVQRRWPDALIQFEDFAQKNAMPLLERYKIACAVLTTTFRAQRRSLSAHCLLPVKRRVASFHNNVLPSWARALQAAVSRKRSLRKWCLKASAMSKRAHKFTWWIAGACSKKACQICSTSNSA